MTTEEAFNRKISRFLRDEPESSASHTIRKILDNVPYSGSYMFKIEEFAYSLGLGFHLREIEISKGKTRFIPCFKYYPENVLNETPRTEDLIGQFMPMTKIDAYSFVAKELVYRLMRVENLDQYLTKMEESPI
ncbi:MAG: hypothetical protein RLP15_08330 [Cryomorphaceae bacterium]